MPSASSNVAIISGVALLASELVGTMSGQVIMREFVNCRIPLFLRRLVTMAPAFTILAVGVNSSHALIVS